MSFGLQLPASAGTNSEQVLGNQPSYSGSGGRGEKWWVTSRWNLNTNFLYACLVILLRKAADCDCGADMVNANAPAENDEIQNFDELTLERKGEVTEQGDCEVSSSDTFVAKLGHH